MKFVSALFALSHFACAKSSHPDVFASAIASGNFSEVGPGITAEHFPIEPSSLSELHVLGIEVNGDIPTDEVLEIFAYLDAKPANLGQMVAVSNKAASMGLSQSFVAFGSQWMDTSNGMVYVPVIENDGKKQKLMMVATHGKTWGGYQLLFHKTTP